MYNSLEPCNPDKVVFNYSSIRISHQLRTLLAFGLDFALPPCKINFYKYYYSFERLAKHMKDKPCRDFHSFIDELRYVSSKFFHKFDSRKFFSVIFTRPNISLIRNIFWKQEPAVRIADEASSELEIRWGMSNGYVLQPELLNLYSDFIMRDLMDLDEIKLVEGTWTTYGT